MQHFCFFLEPARKRKVKLMKFECPSIRRGVGGPMLETDSSKEVFQGNHHRIPGIHDFFSGLNLLSIQASDSSRAIFFWKKKNEEANRSTLRANGWSIGVLHTTCGAQRRCGCSWNLELVFAFSSIVRKDGKT